MVRRARKGVFSTPRPDSHSIDDDAWAPSNVRVADARMAGVSHDYRYDFSLLMKCRLVERNWLSLFRRFFQNRPAGSIRSNKKLLKHICRYVSWFEANFDVRIDSRQDIDQNFSREAIRWALFSFKLDSGRSTFIRTLRNVMTVIGADQDLLPVNPFDSRSRPASDGGESLSKAAARRLLNQLKFEARIVIHRHSQLDDLVCSGSDPRMTSGAPNGAWTKLENRLWLIYNVIGLSLRTTDEMRFSEGLNTEVRGLERHSVSILLDDGSMREQSGWNAHIRYFLPSPTDMAPFILLMMLRTGWNLSTVASLDHEKWDEPYPFSNREDGTNSHSFIVSYKTRGRGSHLRAPKSIKIPSDRRPWSHPYRILSFVQRLTAPLRTSIDERIKLLEVNSHTTVEVDELRKLKQIRDDMFIYRTEKGASSLAWDMERSGKTRSLECALRRGGISQGSKAFRSAVLIFAYETSGNSLFISQLMGTHSSGSSTTLYLRRKQVLDRIFDRSIAIFGKSIKLIQSDKLDISVLRKELYDQGFDPSEVTELSKVEGTTKWGNRCASPRSPPPGFDRGTPPGAVCQSQDCIDGCTQARWFRDSVQHVADALVALEARKKAVGEEANYGSSRDSRIRRCQSLLSLWPRETANAALSIARLNADDHIE